MEIVLLAKSSGDDPYKVYFKDEGGILSVFCRCRAGEFGQLCKHKLSFLKGDAKLLYDPEQKELFEQVQKMLRRFSVMELFSRYEDEVSKIDTGIKKLKKTKKKIRAEFAKKIRGKY